MKLQIICLLLVAIFSTSFGKSLDVNNDQELEFAPANLIIKKLLDLIRSKIPDPLSINKISIKLPIPDVADGIYNLTNIFATGLGGWATKVTSTLSLKLSVLIDIKNVNINTKYFSDVQFFNLIPIYGEGPSNVHFTDLKFNLTSKFKLTKQGLWLSNATFITNVGEATFDIHGLMYNEAFSIQISQILNDIVAPFINERGEIITKIVSPIIEKVVNGILHPKKKNETSEYVQSIIKFLNLDESKLNEDDQISEGEKLNQKNEFLIPKQTIIDLAKLAFEDVSDLTDEEKQIIESLDDLDLSKMFNVEL